MSKQRSFQDVQIELAELSQQIGFYTFQIEIAMPAERQKLFNKMIDVEREMKKHQEDQQKAIDEMKSEMNGKHALEETATANSEEKFQEEQPKLEVVN